MIGGVEWKGWDVIWIDGVPDETARGVGVEGDHEEKCQVVGVPKRLEALLADLVVGSRVHDEHDEQHEMTSDTASLFVVDI